MGPWSCIGRVNCRETSSAVDLHCDFEEKLRLISSSLAEDLGCACPKKRCNMLAMKPSCSIASRSADEVSSNVAGLLCLLFFYVVNFQCPELVLVVAQNNICR